MPSKNESSRVLLRIPHLIAFSAVALGAFYRFWQLCGARFLDPDEYKALRPQFFNPFLYLIYRPAVLVFGKFHATALFTTAALALIVMAVTFAITRKVAGFRAASFAALAVALSSCHILYSRTGYAAMLESLAVLGAVWLVLGARDYLLHSAAIGALMAFATLTHASAYALTFGVALTFLESFKEHPWRRVVAHLVIYALGFLIFYVAGALFYLFTVQNEASIGNCIKLLVEYQKLSTTYHDGAGVFALPREMLLRGGLMEFSLYAFGWFFLLHEAFAGRRTCKVLAIILCASALLFYVAECAAIHALYVRLFIVYVPLIAVGIGCALDRICARTSSVTVMFLWAAIVLSLAPPDLKIAMDPGLRIEPIRDFLSQHQIDLCHVAADLDLGQPGDQCKAVPIPSFYPPPPADVRQIEWPALLKLFKKGKVRFLLTSGIGSHSDLGRDDPMLRGTAPLMAWPHPYRIGNWRPDRSRQQDIELYDLSRILQPDEAQAERGGA